MKIFLIDDEYINILIAEKIMSRISTSLNIMKFTNPLLAYEKLQTENPDLLLLDLNMPQFSGLQFLERMQNDYLLHQVIVLTSSVSRADSISSQRYKNVVEFAEKPLNRDEISRRINACLENKQSFHGSF